MGSPQLIYTGFLVLCYVVYFLRFLGSEEATKKSFPLLHVGDLLPSRADGEVASSFFDSIPEFWKIVKVSVTV